MLSAGLPRKPIRLMLLAAFLCSLHWLTRDFFSSPETTVSANSVSKDCIPLATDESVPAGYWCIPDCGWAFSQTLVESGSDDDCLPTPASLGEDPIRCTEFDQQILGLVQLLMKPDSSTGEYVSYRLEGEGVTGTALTHLKGDQQIPIAARIRWPAGDDLYSEMTAQRLPRAGASAPLVTLPESATVMATRLTQTGEGYCQFIRIPDSDESLESWFQQTGWRLMKPDTPGAARWYWITKDSQSLEVRTHSGDDDGGTTLLLRRVSLLPQSTSMQG